MAAPQPTISVDGNITAQPKSTVVLATGPVTVHNHGPNPNGSVATPQTGESPANNNMERNLWDLHGGYIDFGNAVSKTLDDKACEALALKFVQLRNELNPNNFKTIVSRHMKGRFDPANYTNVAGLLNYYFQGIAELTGQQFVNIIRDISKECAPLVENLIMEAKFNPLQC